MAPGAAFCNTKAYIIFAEVLNVFFPRFVWFWCLFPVKLREKNVLFFALCSLLKKNEGRIGQNTIASIGKPDSGLEGEDIVSQIGRLYCHTEWQYTIDGIELDCCSKLYCQEHSDCWDIWRTSMVCVCNRCYGWEAPDDGEHEMMAMMMMRGWW